MYAEVEVTKLTSIIKDNTIRKQENRKIKSFRNDFRVPLILFEYN